jgi:hypothetical protein
MAQKDAFLTCQRVLIKPTVVIDVICKIGLGCGALLLEIVVHRRSRQNDDIQENDKYPVLCSTTATRPDVQGRLSSCGTTR